MVHNDFDARLSRSQRFATHNVGSDAGLSDASESRIYASLVIERGGGQ